jgi:hypothetical protein
VKDVARAGKRALAIDHSGQIARRWARRTLKHPLCFCIRSSMHKLLYLLMK